jgi:thiol-disulfide isomerase/thioredoxin
VKKILTTLFVALTLATFLFIPSQTRAAEPARSASSSADAGGPMKIYDFWSKYCPHCKAENAFIDKNLKDRADIEILSYEVTSSSDNANLFKNFADATGNSGYNVPALYIGDKSIIGFKDDATTGKEILDVINSYTVDNYPDPILRVQNAQPVQNNESAFSTIRKIPFFGEVDLKALSLPALAIVIGSVDGFNPCALWALIALLSLLIALGDRKKVMIVGGTFVFTSLLITFLFLTAWLNVFAFVKLDLALRLIVGAISLYTAFTLFQSWRQERDEECKPSKVKGHIYKQIDRLSQASFLPYLIAGAIFLAMLVNVIELMCTINLPVIFTKVLQMAHLQSYKNYLYIGLYDIFYMLDDIVVFLIAVLFMKQFEGFNKKYLRATKIIGAIVMLTLAITLVFFPRLLTF